MQFLGGLKLLILSFLGEIQAFYHKTENKVSSANPTSKNDWALLCIILLQVSLMNHSCTNSTFIKQLFQKSFKKSALQFIKFYNRFTYVFLQVQVRG